MTFYLLEIIPRDLIGIIIEEYNPRWSALRRVGHAAVLDFARRPRLSDIVADSVDQTIKTIKEKHGNESPFDPADYIYLTIINILATTCFGKRYSHNDAEFVNLKTQFIKHNANMKYMFLMIFPGFKQLLKKRLMAPSYTLCEFLKNEYKQHSKNFQDDIINSFADSVIAATKKSISEQKESAPYLTDENLTLVLFDLFIAGTDTTQFTLRWALLILTYYPEIQKKLREEIAEQIGDRVATQEDKNRCHLVNAFITEVLRVKNIVPMGVTHRTTCDTVIENHKIPKGTFVNVLQGFIMKDERYWSQPEVFKLERFIDNEGKFVEPHRGYLPFGIGRRNCLGEKLAVADLFFVIVRLLQSTSGCSFCFPEGQHCDLEPTKSTFFCIPKSYKLILKRN